jgi:hypothetical protein
VRASHGGGSNKVGKGTVTEEQVREKQRGTGGEKIWSNRGRKGTQHEKRRESHREGKKG